LILSHVECGTFCWCAFLSLIMIYSRMCLCLFSGKWFLVNGKLVNEKHFPVKGKFGLVFRKMFSFYFRRKTLSGNYEKFRNVILYADYIKFGPQTFDCYIFLFWIFVFQFHPLEFDFYINFGPYFYNCYLLFPYNY